MGKDAPWEPPATLTTKIQQTANRQNPNCLTQAGHPAQLSTPCPLRNAYNRQTIKEIKIRPAVPIYFPKGAQ
jgi:hypothetical protein